MKLVIRKGTKDRRFLLPAKIIIKLLFSKSNKKKRSTKQFINEILACLKTYKKSYGSFVLLEIEEDEGAVVKIIV